MSRQDKDKRVIKTKSAIRQAFIELVQTRDMAAISVSELVEKAGITRSTFYMYYESVADVRDAIEDEIVANLDKIVNENDWLKSMVDPYPLLDAIAKEIIAYDDTNRYLLSGSNSGHLLDKLNQRVVVAFIRFVQDNHVDIDAARAKYIAAFISAGTSECFKLWFNHRSTLSLQELCLRISETVTKGLELLKSIETNQG